MSACALGGAHPAEGADRRDPDVQRESGDFEETAHGYDCSMRSRRGRDRLTHEMEELFADLCQVPRLVASKRGFRPAVDVYRSETPPTITVVVELAGVDPDSIELSVEERALTISGTRPRPRVPGQVYQQAEIEYGRFERRIPLEQDIDAAAATASYEAGLLRITLPVARQAPVGQAVVIVVHRTA